jgi:glycosyltransferase involved in cell wall biosynthesis
MAYPSISIVTCSYQQGRFIDATIRSVLDQAYPALEYLVIDGGSKDNTVEVIQRYADRIDYWVSEKDRGQTHALMKGFGRASGEIQGWLCSDDLLLPGALEFVGRFFEAHPDVDFIFGDALWIDGEGRFLRAKKEMPWDKFVFLYDHNYLAQPSCFWRKSLFDKVQGLDEALHLTMDSDLWLRFAQHTEPRYVQSFLSCMRYYPEQKTRALAAEGRVESERLKVIDQSPWVNWPRKPMSLLAKACRVANKFVHGGYVRVASDQYQSTLAKYHVK